MMYSCFTIGNHLGSTSLVTDSTGAVINQTQYKAWGEERYSSGSKQTNYGYTGQYSYVSDFGLHFYNARWYDSSLGRFTQADSIVPSGIQGYDRYAAMNNNPVRYADPTGHMASDGLGDGGGCDRQCWNERNKPKSPAPKNGSRVDGSEDISLYGFPDSVTLTFTPDELDSIVGEMNDDLYSRGGLLDQAQLDSQVTALGFVFGSAAIEYVLCVKELIACGAIYLFLSLGADVTVGIVSNNFSNAEVDDLRNTAAYLENATNIANANNFSTVTVRIWMGVEVHLS